MNQSMDPPPPPPDFPPPSQTRRSRRPRPERSSNRSSNAQQASTSSEETKAQQQQQQNEPQSPGISSSARTLPHQNTSHPSNAAGPSTTTIQQMTAMHALEVEHDSLPIPEARHSRFPRMPWSRHPFDVGGGDGIMGGMSTSSSGDMQVEGLYYGDVMSSFPLPDDDASIRPNYSTDSIGSQASRFQQFRRAISTSLRSSFSRSPEDDDEDDNDSLTDFKEWTPPDSAYGAAFPICGWVPKHYRRLIEATILALSVFVLVFFVVTTSIRLSLDDKANQDSSASDNSGSSNQFSDDDYYIDYNNDHYNNVDDGDEYDGDNYINEAAGDDDAVGDDAAVDDDVVQADDDAVDNGGDDDAAQQDDDDDARLFLRLF